MVLNYDHVKFLSITHQQNGKLILPTKSVWPIKICASIGEVPILNLSQRIIDVSQSVSLLLSVPRFECQKNTLKIV